MRSLRSATFSIALAVGLVSGVAQANGRFPAAGQVVVDPVDPTHIVLRATFGILESQDSGKSWGWICEQVVGYAGVEDPAMTITGDGTLVAGIFEGLSISHDRGCSWAFAGGATANQYMIDTAIEPATPSHAVAVTSSGVMGGFHVVLVESLDDGKTWAQAGVPVDVNFLAETVDVAPSNPMRVYLSGLLSPNLTGVIERSDDRGMTWKEYDLNLFAPQAGNDFIAAVDPVDPDRIYVRIQGDSSTHMPPDVLAVSTDGASTWKVIYTAKGDLLGFALSPDGKTIAVGGPADGLNLASSTDYAFQSVSKVGPLCLQWTGAGLYACADEFIDGFTLGVTTDEGKTFTHLYQLANLGMLSCLAGGPFDTNCSMVWPAIAATIGAEGDAGAGTASATTVAASAGSGSMATASKGGSGCGCSTPEGPAASAGGLLVLAALIGLRRKKRLC